VYGKKKIFSLGRLERPRHDKNLLYRHDKLNEPTKERGSLYSLSSRLPQFQQSAAATPLSSLFACSTSTPYADSIREPGVFCSIVQALWIRHGSICMIKGLNISCTSSRPLSAGRLILLLYCMYNSCFRGHRFSLKFSLLADTVSLLTQLFHMCLYSIVSTETAG